MTPRKHIKIMGMIFFITLSGAILFNYILDPYDLYGRGIKTRPGDLKNKSFLTKAVKIIQQKPDTIVLGTSTVENGFALPGSMAAFDRATFTDEMQALQNKIPNTYVFNGGVNGGTLYEIYAFLQHAYVNNPKLKHVILGLEWHLFTNEAAPRKYTADIVVLKKDYIPSKLYIETVMSLRTTIDSCRTLINGYKVLDNIQRMFLMIPDFFQSIINKLEEYISKVVKINFIKPESLPVYFAPEKLIIGQAQNETTAMLTSIYYISTLYSDFKKKGEVVLLNPEAFEYLQRIVNFAKEKNIKLDIYITPQHGTHWVTAEKFGLGQYVDRWLKKVADITPYWDFSGRIDFNKNVTEYFSGDDRHFNYLAGQVILPAILHNKVDPKNGIVFVTKKNIDQHIHYRHQSQMKLLKHNKYLADIFSYQNFSNMRELHGSLQKLLVHYHPSYRHYNIFIFMGEFVALPEEYAPYGFRNFIRAEYPRMIYGETLERVIDQINKQSSTFSNTSKTYAV